jgi:hypothetical protein
MSDSPLSEYDSLPPEAVDRIDAVCDGRLTVTERTFDR